VILYSLIETCRLKDIGPEAWLADVIARIADHPLNRLDHLLPWKWSSASAQSKAASEPARGRAATLTQKSTPCARTKSKEK
jgi:hypothetical protein